MKLSTDRAKSVYNSLLVQGITQARMKYQGFGPANPVAPNNIKANRSQTAGSKWSSTGPRRPSRKRFPRKVAKHAKSIQIKGGQLGRPFFPCS